MPQGIVVGSATTSLDESGQVLVHAVHVVDQELDDHAAVRARLGGTGANSGTVRVPAIASVPAGVLSSAKSSLAQVAACR